MYVKRGDIIVEEQFVSPIAITLAKGNVTGAENLLHAPLQGPSFNGNGCTTILNNGKTSSLTLDFGKELQGGVRIITHHVTNNCVRVRLTFGESVAESLSEIGEKNAVNDHSARDFIVPLSSLGDVVCGQTGFRFVTVRLVDSDVKAEFKAICAVSRMQQMQTGSFKSSNPRLDSIVETALHTLKLNFQNGVIWDGIKRDRLVWSGDLNPELLSAMYFCGQTPNVKNALEFLYDTKTDGWINDIPNYSVWFAINVCDYVHFSGDRPFAQKLHGFIQSLLEKIHSKIDENGHVKFDDGTERISMEYFLDWPSYATDDAYTGTAMLILYCVQKVKRIYSDKTIGDLCEKISQKLARYPYNDVSQKQVAAFVRLANVQGLQACEVLSNGGVHGFSTFMSYYILTALKSCGCNNTLQLVCDYYGGMLDKGATSFWEDFDIDWLPNTFGVDSLPVEGKKDIHGDFGQYCYRGFRHSLCHGWSSGVLAYVAEKIIGIQLGEDGLVCNVCPDAETLDWFQCELVTPKQTVKISYRNGKVEWEAQQ